jgi:hypothetical protein
MSGRGKTGIDRRAPRDRRTLLAGSLLLAMLAGGCSSGNTFGGPGGTSAPVAGPPPSGGGVGALSSFFSPSSSAKGPQTVANAQPDVNCPMVDVRRGASTYAIGPAGDTSAMTLKYQAEFIREARSCAMINGNMVMKIGVEGRVIVGPGGGPGQVNVPLRIAIVHETPSGGTHPIATKFVLIPVTFAGNQGSAVFSHVEDAMTFPLPTPTAQLDDYIVYVGFDPQSAEAQEKVPAPRKRRPKPPQPSASAN